MCMFPRCLYTGGFLTNFKTYNMNFLFIILVLIWVWITYSVFKSPCVDDEGYIIPESSAYDSLKKYIKTKFKW